MIDHDHGRNGSIIMSAKILATKESKSQPIFPYIHWRYAKYPIQNEIPHPRRIGRHFNERFHGLLFRTQIHWFEGTCAELTFYLALPEQNQIKGMDGHPKPPTGTVFQISTNQLTLVLSRAFKLHDANPRQIWRHESLQPREPELHR